MISAIFKNSIPNHLKGGKQVYQPSDKDLNNRHYFKKEKSVKRNVFGQDYTF